MLAHSFLSVLLSESVFMAFSTVFHSTKFPNNSPLSHSVLPVLLLPYWFFQLLQPWYNPSWLTERKAPTNQHILSLPSLRLEIIQFIAHNVSHEFEQGNFLCYRESYKTIATYTYCTLHSVSHVKATTTAFVQVVKAAYCVQKDRSERLSSFTES